MKSRQTGFTLVEIAIVLVIIGLLLGGVLKGQELITNAKIRSVTNDIKAVQASFYAYQDRYKAIPGDDAKPDTRFSNTPQKGGGNGVIAGAWETTGSTLSATTESENFWLHLRSAGFLKGNLDGIPPVTELSGRLGVQTGAFGLTGPVVCTSVESKYAQGIDSNLDDGAGDKGIIRGGAAGTTQNAAAGTTAAAYVAPVDGEYITLCMQI